MATLNIPIGPEARRRLEALALAERRSPRQQAALLIERSLGLVDSESTPRQGAATPQPAGSAR